MTPALISASQLRAALGDRELVVFDATYYLPNEGKDAAELFDAAHIPGAQFIDLDMVSDPDSSLPHMLPKPEAFSQMMGARGVSHISRVVVYDQRGLFSAPRLWWMLRIFGHETVQVLDGGLPAWVAAGGATATGRPASPVPSSFEATFHPEKLRSLIDMRANLATGHALVLDARAAGRFDGSLPEPRPGMKSGHIPHAISLPFNELLDQGHLRPPAELRARLAAAGADGLRPVITSCGSGVTAAVLTLAMVVAGLPEGAIYDGSWAEWGSRDDTPIER